MGNRIADMFAGDKKTVHKCSKHPLRDATELCVRCGTQLCGDCRLKEKKEAFCSSRCYRLHLIKGFKLSSLNLLPHLSRLQKHAPALDAFTMMVVLMLVAAIRFAPSGIPEKNIIAASPGEQVFAKAPAPKTALPEQAAIPLKPPEKQKAALPNKTIGRQKNSAIKRKTLAIKQ